jgi:hypothetical protein
VQVKHLMRLVFLREIAIFGCSSGDVGERLITGCFQRFTFESFAARTPRPGMTISSEAERGLRAHPVLLRWKGEMRQLLSLFRTSQVRTSQAQPVEHFNGEHSKHWWKTRDEAQSSALPYWETRTALARKVIAEEIAKLEGASLLEIGCHAGPNLWAAAQLKNFDKIAGVELSPTVLEFTRCTLPDAIGIPVELHEAAADSLPFGDAEFDIVLASLVLVCIGPQDIVGSLDEILRVTKRWLVLGETFSSEDRTDHYPNTTYWIRNYPKLLEGRARLITTRHIEKPDHMGHLDCVMIFEKL